MSENCARCKKPRYACFCPEGFLNQEDVSEIPKEDTTLNIDEDVFDLGEEGDGLGDEQDEITLEDSSMIPGVFGPDDSDVDGSLDQTQRVEPEETDEVDLDSFEKKSGLVDLSLKPDETIGMGTSDLVQIEEPGKQLDGEDLILDSFGSGSGLLDLCLQSEDSSLGAEILEDIYESDATSEIGEKEARRIVSDKPDNFFYTFDETAHKLSKTIGEILELIKNGELREYRDGSITLFKVEDVDKLAIGDVLDNFFGAGSDLSDKGAVSSPHLPGLISVEKARIRDKTAEAKVKSEIKEVMNWPLTLLLMGAAFASGFLLCWSLLMSK